MSNRLNHIHPHGDIIPRLNADITAFHFYFSAIFPHNLQFRQFINNQGIIFSFVLVNQIRIRVKSYSDI